MEKTISSIKYAIDLNNREYFMKLLPIFEMYRAFATDEQIGEFKKLMKDVLKNEEVDYGFISSC